MKRVFPRIFLPLVCLLYACFLVLDLTALADSTWIKYVSILLCFSAALLNHSCQDGRLVVLALLFTAAADWFLLVQNRNYLFGVSLFCIVQFIYSIRLYRLRGPAVLCIASIPHTAFVGVLFRYRYAFRAFGLLFFQPGCQRMGRCASAVLRPEASSVCLRAAFVCLLRPLRRRMESGDLPVLHAFWHVALLFAFTGLYRPFIRSTRSKTMKPSKSLSILLSVVLAVFFLSAAIAFPILCRPFYYQQIHLLQLTERTGWSEQTIREAYDEVMDYLVFDAPFGTGDLAWSEDGQAHFADCKILFQQDFVLLGGSAAALVLLALLGRRCGLRFYRFRGLGPAFWSAAAMGVVYLITAIWAFCDFNSMFTVFHQVFFPGKTNWVFDARLDEIILILPEAFWARTGALVLLLSFGGLCLAALVGELLYRKKKQALQ